ncbi:MAG: hypothetical protein ACREXM_07760 [Gammaproteobacteria bacterium]
MSRWWVRLLRITWCASTACLANEDSLAGKLGISGALRTDYFSSSRSLDERSDLLGTTVQMKALPRLSDWVDGKLEVRVTNSGLNKGDSVTTTWTEAYLNAFLSDIDLRLGKQIVAWGRADAINPTDNLTPRDYTVLLPFDEDQRSGVMGAKFDYYPDTDRTATVFLSFDFKPSKLPLTPPPGRVFVFDEPGSRWVRGVGAKYSETGVDADWSLSFFHGYSLFPEAYAINAGGGVIRLRYPTVDVIGGDYAQNFGRYGFRAEAAYFIPHQSDGFQEALLKPYLYFVVGADRTFYENLNVNVQTFVRFVRDYVDPGVVTDPNLRVLAQQNALTFVQQDRWSPGMTVRISDRWFNDTLQAELFQHFYIKRANAYLQLMLTYAFSDHLKGTIGAQYYQGGDDTVFGALDRNRNVFAELRYSFP